MALPLDLSAGDSGHIAHHEALHARSIDAVEYGASGAGSGDQSSAFTAAKAAIPSGGGTLRVRTGIYRITSTFDFLSNFRWDGDYGGKVDSGPGAVTGSMLRWGGATNGTIARILGKEFVDIDGLHINGATVSGCTGLLIDSANAPATRQVSIRNLVVSEVGTTGTNGTAVQFGVPGSTTDYQMDAVRLSNFEIQTCFTGIRVDSYNALSLSEISHGVFRNSNKSIYLKRCGPMALRHITFGGYTGASPVWIDVESEDSLLIDTCQGEATPTTAVLFLKTTGNSLQPIILHNCTVNTPIELHGIRNVIVNGGYYTEDITLYDGASISLYGVEFAAGKGVVRDASSTGTISYSVTEAGTPAISLDVTADGSMAQFKAGAANPSVRFWNTDATNGKYQLLFPDSDGIGFYDEVNSRHVVRWSPPSNTETAMVLQKNIGGVYTFDRVTVGAADSGGAGYRLLRVPN